jgi:hypothetical protein
MRLSLFRLSAIEVAISPKLNSLPFSLAFDATRVQYNSDKYPMPPRYRVFKGDRETGGVIVLPADFALISCRHRTHAVIILDSAVADMRM